LAGNKAELKKKLIVVNIRQKTNKAQNNNTISIKTMGYRNPLQEISFLLTFQLLGGDFNL
jgi:hypothetical protein